jgi:hypothetical protein
VTVDRRSAGHEPTLKTAEPAPTLKTAGHEPTEKIAEPAPTPERHS